jgi:PBP1b-binding outer membrane lipoprotein LpoB
MMQTKLRISIVLTAALLLTGCAQFERNQPVATVDDDAYCRANSGEPGSSAYAACRKDRDVQSSRASGGGSRIERAHRNLAEDMLNNPR